MATSQYSIWVSFCKEYCNNDFSGVTDDLLPHNVVKAVDKLLTAEANRVQGVSSKTAENIVVESYTEETIPMDVKILLAPFKKMRW